jgi:hypothetical protein
MNLYLSDGTQETQKTCAVKECKIKEDRQEQDLELRDDSSVEYIFVHVDINISRRLSRPRRRMSHWRLSAAMALTSVSM